MDKKQLTGIVIGVIMAVGAGAAFYFGAANVGDGKPFSVDAAFQFYRDL